MSFRTDILGVMSDVLEVLGPNGLDITLSQLTIAVRTWSGTRLHVGTSTDVSITLPKKFPIKQLGTKEVSSSGGLYEMGDILVDLITPSNGAGVGYTPTDLKPTITGNNQERVYIVTTTNAHSAVSGEYALIELRTFRPFTWQLVLRRRITTP